MGAYSTIYITREKAEQYLMRNLHNLTDGELENIMDNFLDKRLYNCRIDGSGEDNNLLDD